MTNQPNLKGVYKHSKSGKMYELVGVALHTETEETLVVYRPLYDCKHELFARHYRMFFEEVVVDGMRRIRFEKINE